MTTVRIPLVGSHTNRDYSILKDQRFVNTFPEVITNSVTQKQHIFLNKRSGTSVYSNPPGTTGEGRGLKAWNSKLYSVIGNKLYSNTTAIKTLTTSTGAVGFEEWSAANDYLILLDGSKGYYISTTDVVTEITDAQFPTPHLPYPVFLDSYIFVQKTTGEIYNCDAGDVTSWAASSFIVPENFPDGAVAIARQNNMLVALGVNSVEFFYDAANPSPGSPLGPNDSLVIQYGCASGTSIAVEESFVFFVAQSTTGGRFVTMLDGGNDKIISTPAIDRILDGEGANIVDCWGYLTRMKGHLFYVLNLPSQSRTVVYDVYLGMWHEWEWFDGATDGIFPMADSTAFQEETYLLHQANGKIYKFSTTVYKDDTQVIKCLMQTTRQDFDTAKIKYITRTEILGDYQTNTSNLSIYWSDDDYKTWTSARTVDLSNRAYIYRCGSTRRRAFKLYHEANTPLRLEALEFEVSLGVH